MSALFNKDGKSRVPVEYAEMKFCEKFHLTPTQYRALPSRLVESWTSMSNIEAQMEKNG